MGTDIHACFQAKDKAGNWIDLASKYEQNRDYSLFGWLAGVRNGTGFAGVVIGEQVTPLAEGRGLPSDFEMTCSPESLYAEYHKQPPEVAAVSGHAAWYLARIAQAEKEDAKAYRKRYDRHLAEADFGYHWMGDHSHTWLTLAEILDAVASYPNPQKTGIVDLQEYERWATAGGEGSPANYCGGVSGPGIKISIEGEVEADTTHVRVYWVESAKDQFAYFLDEIRRLSEECDERGLSDARMVMGFDS